MPPKHIAIRHYMTPQPHTIGADQSLHAAQLLMNALQVRHLPVLEERKIVGVISARELALLEGPDGAAPGGNVADVMSDPPFVVAPNTSLTLVAEEMAARKIGSAVVVDGPRVVGIFTTVDALWALAEMSYERSAAGVAVESN